MSTLASTTAEAPRNGIAGIKHWRSDLLAGLLVSLVSLPLSLGIAIASGAPPITGLISAIIAGLLMPFLGGSFVTISGPAAGLAPALLATITVLGHGNLKLGYPLLLVVIFCTGVVQLVLSQLKAARLSAMFPIAVVEGMLASIGFLIVAKQLPNFIGHPYKAHEFFEYILETPHEIWLMEPKVFVTGCACLVLLFFLSGNKARWAKLMPPQLFVVVFAMILGQLLHLESKSLIHIPSNLLEHGFTLPNFVGFLQDTSLIWAGLAGVLTLTLIDGVESLATASAVDKIDPFHRKSNPDRTLLAMAVCNMCSSLAGGLTIIPGGVKSKVCIDAGGRTLWANFYNAIFLILYLAVGQKLITLIPLSALAAILIHTGYKMCAPKVWKHVAHIGREQLLLFTITVVVTLSTDLLIGIFTGTAVKLVMNAYFSARAKLRLSGERASVMALVPETLKELPQLFRNPVSDRLDEGGNYQLTFNQPLVCFGSLQLGRELARVPLAAESITFFLDQGVTLIDHTSCDMLIHFVEERRRLGGCPVVIEGLDRMNPRSHADNCMRMGPPAPMLVGASDPPIDLATL